MAVRGVGIDLVEVARFAEQLDAAGSVFAQQTFTPGELRAAGGSAGAAQHLAGRFAAKEAFIKAFDGARPGRAPALAQVNWREVEVTLDSWGRPGLVLHGDLAEAARAALGPFTAHLSITHEPVAAGAIVVLEDARGAS